MLEMDIIGFSLGFVICHHGYLIRFQFVISVHDIKVDTSFSVKDWVCWFVDG